MNSELCINERDNVAVLLQAEGDIPAGHKVALCDIKVGETIIKYGYPIGHATEDISAGSWVHTHNMTTNLSGKKSYSYLPQSSRSVSSSLHSSFSTFLGYRRANAQIGIRNELWILPTVGCVADLAQRLALEMQKRTLLNVRAFPHTFGCSQLGDDHSNTRQLLASLTQHPNAGGILLLGLGCENNQLSELLPLIPNKERLRWMEAQKVDDEMEEGLLLLRELASLAEKDVRTEQPLSKLCIGLKCGGSDAFSGITANPLLGKASDWLVSQGATTILTEVPEMFGAEQLLMNRCKDEQTFLKTVSLINDFKQYYLNHGQPVGENPSPGNKAGGITTLEEKSLGCVQKGGTSPVNGVIPYALRATEPGLNLLCAPGNDLVASTALAAAGCQMVLFTTGRGTPFGTCVPTMKISTNTPLFEHKQHWIDFNAGSLLEGESMETLLQEFIKKIVGTANGTPTINEKNNYSGIAIWKDGVTL